MIYLSALPDTELYKETVFVMVPFGYPIRDGMMKNGTGEPKQRHLLIYVIMSSENISDVVYKHNSRGDSRLYPRFKEAVYNNFYIRKCNAADFRHIYSMN